MGFQYRKRYEVTCDFGMAVPCSSATRFNTASGMRSHVTGKFIMGTKSKVAFQYRKRYEVTCDEKMIVQMADGVIRFNTASGMRSHVTSLHGRKAG